MKCSDLNKQGDFMTNFIKLTLILTISVFCMNVMAASQKLMSATNDEDNESIVISVILDSNSDITALSQATLNSRGVQIREKIFQARNVYRGFDLLKKDGRKIVRLISSNFAGHQGGEVTLDFLYSGVTGARRQMNFDLSRNGDRWAIKHNGRNAKKVHFVSNKNFLIGTIGVKKIVVK
jgi:hypothetical protein